MFKHVGDKLYRRQDKELLCIEPWGANSFRVRATQRAEFIPDIDSVLLEPEKAQVTIAIDGKKEIAESEMSELLDIETEVEISKIPLDMIESIEVSGDEFDAIDFMIE